MRSIDLGKEYEELGQLILGAVEPNAKGIFYYAEVEPGVVCSSFFEDVGDRLVYHDSPIDIARQIDTIWEQLDLDDRWHNIRCTIIGDRFEAKLGFVDEVDLSEDEVDRRHRALKEVFGDKPIDYSKGDAHFDD